MKKILIMCLVSFLILSGCGSKKTVETKKKDLKVIETKLLSSNYFKKHESVSKNTMEKKYSINLGDADVMMISSKEYDDATMVLVAENTDISKKSIETFVKSYEDQWVKMNYFPEQKKLVENATYEKTGNYIIYIVSTDNDEVLKIVNE